MANGTVTFIDSPAPVAKATMTIDYHKGSGKTVIIYRIGNRILREVYYYISPRTAERKFRLANRLRGKHIPKIITEHDD